MIKRSSTLVCVLLLGLGSVAAAEEPAKSPAKAKGDLRIAVVLPNVLVIPGNDITIPLPGFSVGGRIVAKWSWSLAFAYIPFPHGVSASSLDFTVRRRLIGDLFSFGRIGQWHAGMDEGEDASILYAGLGFGYEVIWRRLFARVEAGLALTRISPEYYEQRSRAAIGRFAFGVRL